MSHTRMTTFALFLLFELSPLFVFEFDFLSLHCYTNTLRNILMILVTNVEHDEMTCCVQEWQLWRDWGWGHLLLFFFFLKPFLVLLWEFLGVGSGVVCSLCGPVALWPCGLVATLCGAFSSMFSTFRWFIVVFDVSCLALWSPHGEIGNWFML